MDTSHTSARRRGVGRVDMAKRLARQHLVALAIITVVAAIPLIALHKVIDSQEHYASLINLSGRQRMLSQRSLLLANRVMVEQDSTRAEQARAWLNQALDQMQAAHDILTGKAPAGSIHAGQHVRNSAEIEALFFGDPVGLDRQVRAFLADLRALARTPAADLSQQREALVRLTDLALTGLLQDLDRVVGQYERESQAESLLLHRILIGAFLAALLALLWISLRIFRPTVRAIERHAATMQVILDNLPMPTQVVGRDGVILFQSESLGELNPHKGVDESCARLCANDARRCDGCPLAGIGSSGRLEMRDCESERVYEVTYVAFDYAGKPAIMEVFNDVTRFKQAEELLQQAQVVSEQANRLKSEFIANMSHELRTPMNAIMGYADLLRGTRLDQDQRDQLEKLVHSANGLMGLIRDIVDFSRLEQGRMQAEKVDFHWTDISRQFTAWLRPLALLKGLELQVEESPALPGVLRGNPALIERILHHLGDNAVKFNRRGGRVELAVDWRSTTAAEGVLLCTVRDTGIGMTPAQQEALFQPFTQLDGSTTRQAGGTGIGLAICKELVNFLGGEIGVESEEGKGSVFHFSLPLSRGDASRVAAKGSAEVAAVPEISTAPEGPLTLDRARLENLLRELHEAMDDYSTEAGGLARNLRDGLEGTPEVERAQSLCTALDAYDFEQAAVILEQLVEALEAARG